jgi:hypothetical protein
VDSSRERDRSIERLLRQSLKTPQNGGVTDSCLDAETLAALLDGGLSGAALEMAESHLVNCARCQSLVGALARIDSAVPPAEPRHAARGWLAWVVPLTSAAAAVAVWVAVSHHNSARLPQATEIQSQTAGTAAQQPPAPAERFQTPANGNNGERKQTDVAKELRRDAAPIEADSLNKQSASPKSTPSSVSEAQGSASPTAAAAPAVGAAPAAVAGSTAAAGAAPTAPAAPTPPSANMLDSLRLTARRAEVAAAIEIASPDPMVRWRIAGSTVQRSTDGGAGWETQSTGTVAELTAGAAPSPLVCWVVGRGGVVLLSTDGRSWRRVAFPEATDLSAVRPRDARAAAVSTADGRTFSTTDAGATWVPRTLQDF